MTKDNAKKNNKMSTGKKVAIGAGVAALTAASAGAYYLLGPNSKAHQKKASVLLAKMKKEVGMKLKQAKNVTAPLYNKAVDSISSNYSKQHKIYAKEIKALAKKLKSGHKAVK